MIKKELEPYDAPLIRTVYLCPRMPVLTGSYFGNSISDSGETDEVGWTL